MRRSHSVSETSVGLFAFLDVLMSTMGSLILVLMVVSPKIRQEKIAKAATEVARDVVKVEPAPAPKPVLTPAPTPVVPKRETIDLNAKFATRVAELSGQADDKRRTAVEAQRTASAERERYQQLHANREQLERELAELRAAKDRTLASVQDLSAEGVKVESELAKRGSRLRKIRDHIARESTEYSFAAYDGVSGTTRRPIVIECADSQIKFLQEDIALTSADITGFTSAANPLLAGAEALLEYWSTHSAPNDPKPYVLIVVRPSGTLSYYRARNLLERMKAPFGYELLAEDQKLAAPPPDAQAVVACRDAIAKAIAKRESVFRDVFATGGSLNSRRPSRAGAGGSRDDLPEGAGNGTGSNGTGGNGTGSIGTAGKPASPFDDPFGVAATGSTGTAKGSGGDSLLASGNTTTGGPGSGSVGSGGAGPASLGFGGGGLAHAGSANGGSDTGGATGGNAAGAGLGGVGSAGSGSGGVGSQGAGPAGGNAGGQSNEPGMDGSGNSANEPDRNGAGGFKPGGSLVASPAGGTLAGGNPGTGANGQSGVSGSESGVELLPPPGAGTGSDPGSFAGSATSAGAGELGFTAGGGFPQSGQPQTGDGQTGQATAQASSDLGSFPSTPIVQASTGLSQPASGQQGIGGGSGQSDPSAAAGGSPSSPPMASESGGASAQGESSLPGGSPSGASSGSDSGGEPGQSSGGGADGSEVAGLTNSSHDSYDAPPRSGATRRWGYSSPQASIGFEHDVTIWIGARAIVVGGQPPIPINRAESPRRLAALVVPALDREARTWGRPPDHLYWVPNVKFVVSPGGNLPYERLRPAIERHGLVSSVDYQLELESPRQTFKSWVQ